MMEYARISKAKHIDWVCKRCKKTIQIGDPYVTSIINGHSKKYHRTCWKNMLIG